MDAALYKKRHLPFGFQFVYIANLVFVFVVIFSSLPLPNDKKISHVVKRKHDINGSREFLPLQLWN
jgi:hypothetical protein